MLFLILRKFIWLYLRSLIWILCCLLFTFIYYIAHLESLLLLRHFHRLKLQFLIYFHYFIIFLLFTYLLESLYEHFTSLIYQFLILHSLYMLNTLVVNFPIRFLRFWSLFLLRDGMQFLNKVLHVRGILWLIISFWFFKSWNFIVILRSIGEVRVFLVLLERCVTGWS